MTLIKAIETKRYCIELQQIEDEYFVIHETYQGVETTAPMDYLSASIVFQTFYEQMEGVQ